MRQRWGPSRNTRTKSEREEKKKDDSKKEERRRKRFAFWTTKRRNYVFCRGGYTAEKSKKVVICARAKNCTCRSFSSGSARKKRGAAASSASFGTIVTRWLLPKPAVATSRSRAATGRVPSVRLRHCGMHHGRADADSA